MNAYPIAWRNPGRERGLTLVEIMIALTIGLVLIAGILQVFITSKRTYRVQDALARVQENGRFALDFLSREIRMAGYIGCLSDTSKIVNTLNDPLNPLYNFNVPLEGTEGDGLNGSDSVTVRRAQGGAVRLTAGMPVTSADLKSAPANPPPLQNDDIAVITNCAASAAFQITNYTDSNGNVVHNTGGSSVPGNATKDLGTAFGTDADIYKVATTVFYIAAGASGQPALWRTVGAAAAEELVPGVEELQILYGEDTDSDGIANRYVPASTVATMANVVTLRISVLLMTTEDNVAADPQPYTYNGSTVTPADHRLRRVFSSTIKLRNRGQPA